MNQKFISLVAILICACLLAGCATQNSRPVPQVTINQPKGNTPFDKYDSALVQTVQNRWFDLLNSKPLWTDRKGKVVVQFHLHSDGTVSDLKILDNEVGDLHGYVCEKAIKSSAPFGPWPPDMVRMLNEDYRTITFTFNYY